MTEEPGKRRGQRGFREEKVIYGIKSLRGI